MFTALNLGNYIVVTDDQNTTAKKPNRPQTADENLIEAILLLHSLATPAATIVRRVQTDQATVSQVVKHGTLPARQLALLWDDCAVAS